MCKGGSEAYGRKVWQQYSGGGSRSVRVLYERGVGYIGSSCCAVSASLVHQITKLIFLIFEFYSIGMRSFTHVAMK